MPGHEFRPRAAEVDILDAQQEAAAGRLGLVVANERRQRMAEMQLAVGAGRKTEDRPVICVCCNFFPALCRDLGSGYT